MSNPLPWYKEGLNFSCTECGQCCTGSPGYVWISVAEMKAMAKELNISLESFTQRYVRRVGERYSLKETAPRFDCILLDGKRCRVYKNRPKQCRTFPFWPENVQSRQAWENAAKECEGIRNDAPRVSAAQIEEIANGHSSDI